MSTTTPVGLWLVTAVDRWGFTKLWRFATEEQAQCWVHASWNLYTQFQVEELIDGGDSLAVR